jgi:hypothetical protein
MSGLLCPDIFLGRNRRGLERKSSGLPPRLGYTYRYLHELAYYVIIMFNLNLRLTDWNSDDSEAG